MGSPPDAEFVQEYLLPLRAHRLDLPLARLPRWGVLSGKSPCTRRRWRLYFVELRSFGAGKESGIDSRKHRRPSRPVKHFASQRN